jgi:hypothetical protein
MPRIFIGFYPSMEDEATDSMKFNVGECCLETVKGVAICPGFEGLEY